MAVGLCLTGRAMKNDTEGLLCCSGKGLAPCGPKGRVWCWMWFLNLLILSHLSLWRWSQCFLGQQHGTKSLKEVPAVRSTFSCVVEVPQPFTVKLFMDSLSLRLADVVGDTGDGHCVLESDMWVSQRAHTASPCRGRRLHDTGGPGDVVPH